MLITGVPLLCTRDIFDSSEGPVEQSELWQSFPRTVWGFISQSYTTRT